MWEVSYREPVLQPRGYKSYSENIQKAGGKDKVWTYTLLETLRMEQIWEENFSFVAIQIQDFFCFSW